MPQITPITSEALQAKIRQLLPSQIGFGEDLQAQNVIVPTIDLTETASGSLLRQDLQTSLAFASADSFNVSNTTTTIINTTGFFRVIGGLTIKGDSSDVQIVFELSDGVSDVQVYGYELKGASSNQFAISVNVDFIVFLRSGDTLKIVSNSNKAIARGSTRQIADINGNLVNPSGFTFE
jgi:hypothetical protein